MKGKGIPIVSLEIFRQNISMDCLRRDIVAIHHNKVFVGWTSRPNKFKAFIPTVSDSMSAKWTMVFRVAVHDKITTHSLIQNI
jgi:hypothetical protein